MAFEATMTVYSLRQICEILGLDEAFAAELVSEAILLEDVSDDVASPARGYSPRMLERARVARELVQELDVNLAGAAVIVRLREEVVELRHAMCGLARELERTRRP